MGDLFTGCRKGYFPMITSTYLGRGTFLNGEQVSGKKPLNASAQDEEVHRPLFGHGDYGCNFVMVQRCNPLRDSNEDTLVQAVGCHVNIGTFLKFRINDKDACFGF